jgi:hypothetical protein
MESMITRYPSSTGLRCLTASSSSVMSAGSRLPCLLSHRSRWKSLMRS